MRTLMREQFSHAADMDRIPEDAETGIAPIERPDEGVLP